MAENVEAKRTELELRLLFVQYYINMAGMIRYRGYGSKASPRRARVEVVGSVLQLEDKSLRAPPPTYQFATSGDVNQEVRQLPPLKDRTMFLSAGLVDTIRGAISQ